MENQKLPKKFFAAQRQFFSLENKFIQNSTLAETYKTVIDTKTNLKPSRKISQENINDNVTGVLDVQLVEAEALVASGCRNVNVSRSAADVSDVYDT